MQLDLESQGSSGMTPKAKVTNIMGNYDKQERILLTPHHSSIGR